MKRLGVVVVGVLAAYAAAAAPVTFTGDDAKAAFDAASAFVKECTPRHAGTLRGRLAANWLLGNEAWADIRRTGIKIYPANSTVVTVRLRLCQFRPCNAPSH